MQVINDKIYMIRGESDTYDALVKDKKTASPMMIDEKLNNPYIEFIVRPEIFKKGDDLTFRYYLDVSDNTIYHKFKYTHPSDIVPHVNSDSRGWETVLEPYGEDVYKLHSLETTENGVTTMDYRYWDTDKREWTEYELRIMIPFTHLQTQQFDGKTYKYQINLVAGNKKENAELGEIPIVVDYLKILMEPEDFIVGGTLHD